VRSSLKDPSLSDKLSNSDKSELQNAVDGLLKWLDANQSASKEEFEFRMNELEGKVNPIMTKAHQAGGAPSNEPTVEELD
jgi:heat shock protein 1/8